MHIISTAIVATVVLSGTALAQENKLGACYSEDSGTLSATCEKVPSIEMSAPEAFGEMLKSLEFVFDGDIPGYFVGTTGMLCMFLDRENSYYIECQYPQKSDQPSG